MLRASPSVGPMLSLQASPSQQARSPSLNAVNTPETLDGYLCVPLLHSMFSTPEVFLQKNQKALCFERVFRELDAGELSWDMSLIKPEGNSPKVCVDPSVLEQTWSPRLQLSLSAEESLGSSDWDRVPAWHLEACRRIEYPVGTDCLVKDKSILSIEQPPRGFSIWNIQILVVFVFLRWPF